MLNKYIVVYDVDGDISLCIAELTATQASRLSFKPSVCAVTLLSGVDKSPTKTFDYLNKLEDET